MTLMPVREECSFNFLILFIYVISNYLNNNYLSMALFHNLV
jgi:hypothetical protein